MGVITSGADTTLLKWELTMLTYLICYSDVTSNHGIHGNIPDMLL